MFVEMEAPLGGAKREHFTLEVLPQLLQKGERLAVEEPARDPQMSAVKRLYRAKVHRWRETRQSPGHLSPCLLYLPGFRVHYEYGQMAQSLGTCAWYVRMQWILHCCGRLQVLHFFRNYIGNCCTYFPYRSLHGIDSHKIHPTAWCMGADDEKTGSRHLTNGYTHC